LNTFISGVKITPLKRIQTNGGDVLHALKKNDDGYSGFEEAYFSLIQKDKIKGWKKHLEMTLNLIVPSGEVLFVIYDDREKSKTKGLINEITISKKNYIRLTVPPMLWVGFQGKNYEESIVLNISNIIHNPNEVKKKELKEIEYKWD